MASSSVSVATANTKLLLIYGNMSSIWWAQVPLNGINARLCKDRLEEIVVGGKTATIDAGANDVYALL